MRIMGLDVGEKRIGIALSDELRWTAQGERVLERTNLEADLQEIVRLVTTEEVAEVVVGLPKNMNGTLGEGAEKVLSFTRSLEAFLTIPLILWDERWTTTEATRLLLQADMSRKKRRKVIDKMAAALILQGYLDSVSKE